MSPNHFVQANISRLSSSSSEYSTDKTTAESNSPKVVLKTHGLKAWPRYWIHAAAVLTTAGVAAVNFLNIYLMDVDRSNTNIILGVFQFVAKLHEVLAIGSMILIIMDMVRDLLIKSSVPLGLMLSHTLFTDLNLLISFPFWSSLNFSRSTAPLTVLLLFSIPFANLVGPLYAISVVPRLGWSTQHAAQIFPSFWNASASNMWPDVVAASALPRECFQQFDERNKLCPRESFLEMKSSNGGDFLTVGMQCTSAAQQISCNATYQTSGTSSIFREMSAELDFDSLTVYSSTPTIAIFDVLANRFSIGMAAKFNISDTETIDAVKTQLIEVHFMGNQQMYKPVVKATCQSLTYAEAFDMIKKLSLPNRFDGGDFFFTGDFDGSSGSKFLYTIDRRNQTLPEAIRGNCTGQDCYAAFSCGGEARWAPMSLWYNTAQGTFLYQSDPQPRKVFESSSKLSQTRPITIKQAWLNDMVTSTSSFAAGQALANMPVSMGDGTDNPSFTGVPSAPISSEGSQQPFRASNYTQGLSMFFSVMLTQALAQIPSGAVGSSLYNGDCSNTTPNFTFNPLVCDQLPTNWIHAPSLPSALSANSSAAVFTVRRSGYRWGLDSTLVIVALAFLLLHALLTLIYTVYILATKRQYTTHYSTAPEMLLLAINSLRAPALYDPGKKEDEVWREPVCVRELDDQGLGGHGGSGEELTLVVGDVGDYGERVGGRALLGRKYR